MQRGNRVFDSLCHRVNCGLFRKRLAANDGADSGINSGEVLVFVPVQRVCLGDGRVNRAVIRALVLQGGKGIFDSLCHGIYFALLGNVFTTDNGIDGGFHSGEILVVILLQSICLGEGCIDLGVVRALARQHGKITVLHKCVAQPLCHGSVFKFFCRLFQGAFRVFCRSTFSVEAVLGDDLALVVSRRISP